MTSALCTTGLGSLAKTVLYPSKVLATEEALVSLKSDLGWANISRGLSPTKGLAAQIDSWLDSYLHGGYDNLLKRATVERKQLLTLQKQRIVRYIILHKMPVGYGIDSYQWTAEHVRTVIEQKWQIKISCARLYQLFDKWGLSLQRAHRDYGPVNRQEQAQFHR